MARFRFVEGVVAVFVVGTLFGLACAPGGAGSAAAAEGETGDADDGAPPPSGTGAGSLTRRFQNWCRENGAVVGEMAGRVYQPRSYDTSTEGEEGGGEEACPAG